MLIFLNINLRQLIKYFILVLIESVHKLLIIESCSKQRRQNIQCLSYSNINMHLL